MIQLLELKLEDLDQRNTLAFAGRIRGILDEAYPDNPPDVIKKFKESVDYYIMAQQQASASTDKKIIANCDSVADDAWRSMDFQLKAGACAHHNETFRNAALEVQKTFNKYKDPTDMRYDKEYEVLDKLLGDLEKLPMDLMKAARVDENLIGLRKAVEDFRTLFTNKINPKEAEEMGLAKEMKKQMVIWWNAVAAQLKADTYTRQDNVFVGMIEKLNAAIRAVLAE